VGRISGRVAGLPRCRVMPASAIAGSAEHGNDTGTAGNAIV
jgi:hypothetical protein